MVITIPSPASWKTTVSGFIAAASSFIVAYPSDFAKWPWVGHLAAFTLAGGLAGFALAAKDSNVTGGTTVNSSNDPSAVKATAVVKEPAPPKV